MRKAGSSLRRGILILAIGIASLAACQNPAASRSYMVYYHANGGTGTVPASTVACAAGSSIRVQEGSSLTLSGYRLFAWNTKADGSGTSYSPGALLVMPDSPVDLYAQWAKNNEYSISYNANGASGDVPVNSESYSTGNSISVADVGTLTKVGFSFGGWNTKADGTGSAYAYGATISVGTEDIILYATWIANRYAVRYFGVRADAPEDPTMYLLGDKAVILPPKTLEVDSYLFKEWNTEADGTGIGYAVGSTATIGVEGLTLFGIWVFRNSVQYSSNGPACMAPQDLSAHAPGSDVLLLSSAGLSWLGHEFLSWNTKPDGSGTSYAEGSIVKMPDAILYLYAQWKALPTYTITYLANLGSGTVPVDGAAYFAGASVLALYPTGLSRAGYSFMGWNTQADGLGTAYAVGAGFSMGSSSLFLYAQWRLIPTYTVTYAGNGNTGGSIPVDSRTYEAGSRVTLAEPGTLARSGYSFWGWSLQPEGEGPRYSPGGTIQVGNGDLVVYALWTAKPVYRVLYSAPSAEGSVPSDPMSYLQGSIVTVLGGGDLRRTNYAFVGWNTANDGGGTAYAPGASLTMASNSIYLYAVWTPTYGVSFDANAGVGNLVVEERYVQGSSVSLPGVGAFTRAGYVQTGWNTASNGSGTSFALGSIWNVGTSDLKLYAMWSPLYRVYYDANGGTGAEVDASYYSQGSSVLLAGSGGFSRGGYVQSGWNTASNGTGISYAFNATWTVGASNLNLYAVWVPTYIVMFYPNYGTGSVSDPNRYLQGTSVTLPGAGGFSRNGYVQSSWNTNSSGTGTTYELGATWKVGTTNLALYAIWVPAHTLTYNGNGGTGDAPTDSGSYRYGAKATVAGPGGLSRAGYAFLGWNTSSTGTGTEYSPGAEYSMGLSDAVLYAHWSHLPTYTVTYLANGGSGTPPIDGMSYLSGASASLAANVSLARAGYIFGGWNSLGSGLGINYLEGEILVIGSANVVLYARWIPTYTVTYHSNGASGSVPIDPSRYVGGAACSIAGIGTLAKPGYSFSGWNSQSDGLGIAYQPGASTTIGSTNLALYAQWIENTGIRVHFIQPTDETISLGPAQALSKSSSLSVSISEGFDQFTWYLDGNLQAGSYEASLTLPVATLSYGSHNLTAVVRKGSLWYSKTLYFTVKP